MKMLKQFKSAENHKLAEMVVYENVQFPNGFSRFLDAIEMEGLADDNHSIQVDNKYQWANKIGTGGIKLETTSYPYVQNSTNGDMIVMGSKQSLEIFQSIVERHHVSYIGSPTKSSVEYHIEYHEELNPDLWDLSNNTTSLHSDVQQALEDVTQAFYEFLEVDDLPIEDVTITGSSANFNWTKSSDIDLHIIVNMQDVELEFGKLAAKYFDAKKKLWNDLHDIKIKGIPVEIYVQDDAEVHNSTGIYSISEQEWVIEPKHEPPSVDDVAVNAKVSEWTTNIKNLMSSNKADVIESFMKRLRKLRQSGLDAGGEFSVENVAFKILRNEGWLDKLVDLKTKIFDRELSVEEEEWSILN
jgi:predicted nucleotidyltransferase